MNNTNSRGKATYHEGVIVELRKKAVQTAPFSSAVLCEAANLIESQQREIEALRAQINSPEIINFLKGVQLEAVFQRQKWSTDYDGGKTDADWFWLIGYLAGKAIRPGASEEKRLHRIITVAAASCNWHAALLGKTTMRPGIGIEAALNPEKP